MVASAGNHLKYTCMKKLFFAAAFFISAAGAFAQTTDWYVSVSIGPGWGGPQGSLKNKFEKTGFNQTSEFSFFGLGSNTSYPIVYRGVPVLVRAGKKLKGKKSIYVVAGTSAAAEVSGYKREGSFGGVIAGTFGTHINMNYKVTQIAAGLENSMPKSRIKLGYAPGAFLLRYHNTPGVSNPKKTTSVVPGLALTGRLPLGREKNNVGVELVADINLAPPATIKEQYKMVGDNISGFSTVQALSATKVNMVHGTAGLALTLRKKKNV